jgi:hypothetical protein
MRQFASLISLAPCRVDSSAVEKAAALLTLVRSHAVAAEACGLK